MLYKGRIIALIVLVTSMSASPAFAQSSARGGPPSIFAYPGQTCPGGTERYKGPEQVAAGKTGAVLCHFQRSVVIISKALRSTCPPRLKPHVEAGAKPDDDVIWCDEDMVANPNLH